MTDEIKDGVKEIGLKGTEVRMIVGSAILGIKNGEYTANEAATIFQGIDSATKRMQLHLNSIKLQMQCRQAGDDFGEMLKLSKKLLDEGYAED